MSNEALLKKLSSYGVNTTSRIRAQTSIRDSGFDDLTYRSMIVELTGRDVVLTDEDEVESTFRYLTDMIVDDEEVNFDLAIQKAVDFVANNPYVKAKKEYTSNYTPKSTVDALGKPKQKKGAKKAKAVAFWNENQGQYTTRKEWIEALMEAVDLTKAGASTYYHNLKTGSYK